MSANDIERVRARHESRLLALPNVTSVGIGERDGRPTILVMVTHKVPSAALNPEEVIPGQLEGYGTMVVESGAVTAQQIGQQPRR